VTRRYAEAVAYACAAHRGQVRKGSETPYVAHPLAVSALVLQYGGDEDQAIAALLHDVLEDCGAEHDEPSEDHEDALPRCDPPEVGELGPEHDREPPSQRGAVRQRGTDEERNRRDDTQDHPHACRHGPVPRRRGPDHAARSSAHVTIGASRHAITRHAPASWPRNDGRSRSTTIDSFRTAATAARTSPGDSRVPTNTPYASCAGNRPRSTAHAAMTRFAAVA